MLSLSPIDPSLCSNYFGVMRVRPGRESELKARDWAMLAKDRPDLTLVLRPDGTFEKQLLEGIWRQCGTTVQFQPQRFGGETCEAMRKRTESAYRHFTLEFLFTPFELHREGASLASFDDFHPTYIEYQRAW